MTGLVLAGGGVKGSYQVGAYLAFKKCGIKIDGVVGTSIGSFNGAMIASGMDAQLYDFWKNVDVGALLNFNSKYIESVNGKDKFKELIYGIEQMTLIVKNKGISNANLKKLLNEMIDEEKIRNSYMDYGLVTVRVNDLKPLYLFKEDMKKGKIAEYILASCNLPVFKTEKLIDNKYYIDGGFFDNNPINMLLNKGYNRIYSIEIQGLGFSQKVKDTKKVIKITPSRFLGSTLNVNKKKINENIKIGYYDTMKILKNYDGYNFIFKKHVNLLYNTLARKIGKDLYNRCKRYFQAKNNKELIIKSLEYIMLKEEISYFNVYDVFDIIKHVNENTKSKHFVYEFVRKLRLF
ncbi:MAG: patatin-like phospholipase family protein [Firmicutes bacterium]|nr:patatin-like phospholipase family protein [Bacillota bacterium]